MKSRFTITIARCVNVCPAYQKEMSHFDLLKFNGRVQRGSSSIIAIIHTVTA
jgi:hypothetical protein